MRFVGITFLLFFLSFFVQCDWPDRAWTVHRRPLVRHRNLSINDAAVQAIVRTKEGVWFGLPSGLVRYHRRFWTGYSKEDGIPGRVVWSIFSQGDSLLWIGAEDGLALRRNGAFQSDSSANLRLHNAIAVIADDKNVFVGTSAGVFAARPQFLSSGVRLDSLTFLREPGAEAESLYAGCLELDCESGNLWIGTRAGVVRIDRNGAWDRWSEKEQLPSNTVYDILWDKERRCLWTATAGGLSRIVENGLVERVDAELPDSVVTCLGKQNTRLWIGTLNGANLLDPSTGEVTSFFEKDGLANNAIRSVFADQQSVWFGCLLGGIARFQGER